MHNLPIIAITSVRVAKSLWEKNNEKIKIKTSWFIILYKK